MGKNTNIAVIILAAGDSSRMGDAVKQLLPWGNSNLLGIAIEQGQRSIASEVYVVLGANSLAIKEGYQSNETIFVENPDWKNGMGSSISCGINAIIESEKNYEAAVIMLADQPLMDSIFLNQLIDSWITSDKTIVATVYKNRAGVPAIFDKIHFTDLLQLNQDIGAKEILANNDILVLDSSGKAEDIDTLDAYNKLYNDQFINKDKTV